jgi:hypothetical protein
MGARSSCTEKHSSRSPRLAISPRPRACTARWAGPRLPPAIRPRRNVPSASAYQRTRRSAARAGPASRCWDSRAVEAAEGRSELAVAIAAAAQALSERAGIVVAHPMDPQVVSRIDALKASIPKGRLDGLVANARVLSPAAVLAMVGQAVGAEAGAGSEAEWSRECTFISLQRIAAAAISMRSVGL